MDPIIAQWLSDLDLGQLQEFQNMAVSPLFASLDDSPAYLTLKEALDNRVLTVTEVNQGGSVPELKAINKGDTPILLLDGEELVGAKQNRVLNTTILLKEKSETVIPVSCTEAGRWSSVSGEFAASAAHASPSLRRMAAASVSASLRRSLRFEADQQAVWGRIEEMAEGAQAHSPTRAMSDIFESRAGAIDDYLKAFQHLPHQRGLLVFTNGQVTGCDTVSLESAYEALHPKLVKSYAMEALLDRKEKPNSPTLQAAREFLEEAALCEEKQYDSIGHGRDYRFESKGIVGSALVHQDKVIHLALFAATEADKVGPISSSARRRRFRV